MSSENPRRSVTISGDTIILQDAGSVDTSSVKTFTDGDTTPDVSGASLFREQYTSAKTITNFDGVTTDGYTFRLLFTSGYVSIAHNSNIDMVDGALWGPGVDGDILEFTYDGSNNKWLCLNVVRME